MMLTFSKSLCDVTFLNEKKDINRGELFFKDFFLHLNLYFITVANNVITVHTIFSNDHFHAPPVFLNVLFFFNVLHGQNATLAFKYCRSKNQPISLEECGTHVIIFAFLSPIHGSNGVIP